MKGCTRLNQVCRWHIQKKSPWSIVFDFRLNHRRLDAFSECVYLDGRVNIPRIIISPVPTIHESIPSVYFEGNKGIATCFVNSFRIILRGSSTFTRGGDLALVLTRWNRWISWISFVVSCEFPELPRDAVQGILAWGQKCQCSALMISVLLSVGCLLICWSIMDDDKKQGKYMGIVKKK